MEKGIRASSRRHRWRTRVKAYLMAPACSQIPEASLVGPSSQVDQGGGGGARQAHGCMVCGGRGQRVYSGACWV